MLLPIIIVFLQISFDGGFEGRNTAGDHICVDTGAQTHEAGTAEICAGNDQQIEGFGMFGECKCISAGGLDEHVESALRLDAFVSECSQIFIQQLAVGVIDLNVGTKCGAACDRLLKNCGRADMTAGTGSTGNGGINGVMIFHTGGNTDIADTVTGNGEGLGVGIADNGVGIDCGNEGNFDSVIDQLTIGLVGNQIDGVPNLCTLAAQKRRNGFQGGAAVNNTGGIVGGIDDQKLGIGRDALFQRVHGDLEGLLIRGNDNKLVACGLSKNGVLREERSNCDGFCTFHIQSVKNRNQSGSSTAGKEQIGGRNFHAEALGEILGDGVLCFRASGSGGIAVNGEAVAIGKIAKCLIQFFRSGYGRVADGKVIYILFADDGCLAKAVFKQVADDTLVGSETEHILIDHGKEPPF